VDERVPSSTDEATGLPVYSLYGDDVRPTDAMLAGLDALVFDIQDAGVRFYTYITTMGYTMEAAAKHHLAYYVLDRPNPLGGERIEGPMLDRERTDFTGYFPMPVRMAMTLGEMAQMFNAENRIGCDLHVILIQNWSRRDWFDATGLPWVDPSRICVHSVRRFCIQAWRSCKLVAYPWDAAQTGHSSASERPGCAAPNSPNT